MLGRDCERGSGVEHTSHSRKEGWLRKVHAVHATLRGLDDVGAGDGDDDAGEGDGEGERSTEGREDEEAVVWLCIWICFTMIGIELRRTPHKEQTWAAVAVLPEGFFSPHTSHSQLLGTPCSTLAAEEAPADGYLLGLFNSCALPFTAGPADKNIVTFGEEVNSPA